MARDMEQLQSCSKAFLRIAADFLWPPRSLVSRERGLGKGPLAPHEFGRIHFLSGAVCNRCGMPLGAELDDGATCAVCIARPPRWDRARAALVYEAASRRLVLDLKRSGRRDGLSAKARRRNMAGAFAPHPKRTGYVQGKRVLLIDDVLTTGATLSACTRALKRAGARHVDVLVLARVVRETDVTI